MNTMVYIFIINAFVSSILSSIVFVFKTYIYKENIPLWLAIINVFTATFCITLITYFIMNKLIGFGEFRTHNILPTSVATF